MHTNRFNIYAMGWNNSWPMKTNISPMAHRACVANSFLPHSQITVAIGMNYRKLLFDNFELNGYEPDIKCADGMDALTVAMAEIEKTKALQSSTPER